MRVLKGFLIGLVAVLLTAGVLWATSNTWNYPVPTLAGLVTGDVIYARDSSHLGNISPSTTGYPLLSQGASTAPAFGQVSLSAGVTGTLPAANGGTGSASYTVGDMLYASAGTTLSKLTAAAAGKVLRAAGATTAPAYSTFTIPDTFATGDLVHASGTNTLTALSAVAVGQTLVSAGTGTVPAWSATPRLGKQLRTTQAVAPTCADTGKCSAVVGSDSAGIVTIGATPANDFVLTFNAAWVAAPACTVTQQTTANNYITKAATATDTLTISTAAGPSAADKISYICVGVQ